MDFALWIYESNNFERVLILAGERNWIALANEFEMLFMMYLQKRDQVDTPGKPRFVVDAEFVLTEGQSGYEGPADKRVTIDGIVYDDFSATRARVVQAAPWFINVLCSLVSTGHMYAMFEEYPVLFHTSTAEQLKELMDGFEVYAGDVTEYDRSMDEGAITVPFEVARQFWDPRLIDIAERLMFACYYSKPLSIDGEEGFWVGSLFADGKQVICGNRSGHAWTSLIAKGNKVVDDLIVMHNAGYRVIGHEHEIMKGLSPIRIVNNGDDGLVIASKEVLAAYLPVRNDKRKGHYLVGREDGTVYSGMLSIRPNLQVAEYFPTARLHTAFEKMYCPERSIGGIMRPEWHIGVIDRINNREQHPMGGVAWEIHDRLFADMLAPHFGTLNGMLTNATLASRFAYDDLTRADLEVLEDPDKLHYKFTLDEINPDIVAISTSKVGVEVIMPLVEKYYRGNLV
jgi:hypothetical protein